MKNESIKWVRVLTGAILIVIVLIYCMTQSKESERMKSNIFEGWTFTTDEQGVFNPEDVLTEGSWRTAQINMSWQAQFEDLRDYQGTAWYRNTLTVPKPKAGQRLFIRFEAVDYQAWVYLNGRLIGEHEGGYTPFKLEIGNWLVSEGENVLLVKVYDPPDKEDEGADVQYYNIPHGKQNWYIQNSGIWQQVSLETRPEVFITSARITADIHGETSLDVDLDRGTENKAAIQGVYRLFDPDQDCVHSGDFNVAAGETSSQIQFKIESPKLWDIDQPHLYRLELELPGGDRVSERYGYREFRAENGELFLNGEPFFMIAALDQAFFPTTIYTPPSIDYLYDQVKKAKALGLNTLRSHIKIPVKAYLDIADELGLLVWYEVPNWDVFSESAGRRSERLIDEALARDWNHPSLVVLGIINESWGINLEEEAQRKWLVAEYDRLKQKATGRLVVDNSACWGNYHLKTDINDYHTYWAIPENRQKFQNTLVEMQGRPAWLFSPHGDAQETGKEPLILSEFGNWGLPELNGDQPFWFERPFFDIEVTLPAGVRSRFREYAYNRMFTDYNDLARASQQAQFTALKWEIEQIRLREAFNGYVITELTDLNWEANGLMTMDRLPKVYASDLAHIQQQTIIIPSTDRFNHWDEDPVLIELHLSSTQKLDGITGLRWWTESGEEGVHQIPSDYAQGVHSLGALTLPATRESRVTRHDVHFELLALDERILAQNYLTYYSYPKPGAEREQSANADWNESGFSDQAESLILATGIDEELLTTVKSGRNVLCVLNASSELPESVPIKLTSKDGEWYDGNWASNFNWWDPAHPILDSLAVEGRIGLQLAETIPPAAFTNIPSDAFQHVTAGMFVGWIHLNSAYLLEVQIGEGRLLLTTFPLLDEPANNPFAQTLLSACKSYLEQGHPQQAWVWELTKKEADR
ncbi:MAG: hypothetical protein K9N38_07325 [Candidatus Marinimicrobia bacterium]|nr:hypothetical protein [Candidatus Neomarinimicrobiota bacterium]MCF7850936.1 hypothetical protein [Candidatus Neomarinimicrobiota bacterium]